MDELTYLLNETMPGNLWLEDVISIGDSEHERIALDELRRLNAHIRFKSVKLMSKPSLEMLVK